MSRRLLIPAVLVIFAVAHVSCGSELDFESLRGSNNAVFNDDLPSYDTRWFDARIDNFNPQNKKTYKMRYLVNDKDFFGKRNGDPIFFYTGNEGNILDFWKATGFMFENAPDFKALIVFAEHRYYGESLPFGKDSWSRENVGFLTIEQALADYANLIDSVKSHYNIPDSPVVVFGGSYGGMLSAWFRFKYPNVVDAALAASAPILYTTTGENDPKRFFEIVTQDFEAADKRCPDIVRKAYAEVDSLKDTEEGRESIRKSFSLCKAPNAGEDIEQLKLWSTNAFTTMSMGDYPYSTGFLGSLPAWPVKKACKDMIAADTPMDALAAAIDIVYNSTQDVQCNDMYKQYVFCADQTGCGQLQGAGLSWDYQACTEINMPMVTNNVTDMFPPRKWTEKDLSEYCMKTWGTTPTPDWVRVHLGGKDISSSSRIILSNGLLDPWHGGGFLESLSDSLVAIKIPLGAHHLDLRASNPEDPADVIAARKQEVALLHKWVAEARVERGLENFE